MEGYYHVWFSTKRRRPALEGELGDFVTQALMDVAQRTGIQLVEAQAAVDHMHLLLQLSGAQTLPWAMQRLKGASARRTFLEQPGLKLDMSEDSFWQRGYGWRRITTAEVPAVRRYIRTQLERPLRHNA